MSPDSRKPAPKPPRTSQPPRQQELAEALRENLHRRKAQAQARAVLAKAKRGEPKSE